MEVHLLMDEELLAALPASDLEPPQDRAAGEYQELEQKAQSIMAYALPPFECRKQFSGPLLLNAPCP